MDNKLESRRQRRKGQRYVMRSRQAEGRPSTQEVFRETETRAVIRTYECELFSRQRKNASKPWAS